VNNTSNNPNNLSLLTRLKHFFGPNWLIIVFFASTLLLLSCSRLMLMIWQAERVNASEGWLQVLISGMRIDASILSYVALLALLVTSIGVLVRRTAKFIYPLLLVWLSVFFVIFAYLEVITPSFIMEYDLRPNRIFIEYLIYPKEVSAMLWSGYKLEILIATSTLVIATVVALKLFRSQWQERSNASLAMRSISIFLLVALTVVGARSSFGHRPINPAMVAFSTDHLINDLILNSTYSVGFAINGLGAEKSSERYYGEMDDSEVLQVVRQASNLQGAQYKDQTAPTSTYRQASNSHSKKNIVILLQESLGARYVGGLGGLPLTPHLDKLMQEGWNFTNLYATGTRSVRGIEAVLSGFTPTPSRSVVKLSKSQTNFFTMAGALTEQGYHSQFIYGGESHFDNMKSFFLGNGFVDIVDGPRFEKIDFEASWGASDEDLYDQAHLEFERLAEGDQPFFSLVFTSSNHSPFEFPEGKIELYDSEPKTRNNAAKYADHALGEFMQKAKNSSYWKDTIFIVVADHDSRVHGASLVPIEYFRIPGVILGEGISPKTDSRLISHIDLAPTLLSLAGISGDMPMLGHDLTREVPVEKQRVMMQYDKNFAYMTTESVTVLQPEKSPLTFEYKDKAFKALPLDKEQARKARAHVIFGSKAYDKGWYH